MGNSVQKIVLSNRSWHISTIKSNPRTQNVIKRGMRTVSHRNPNTGPLARPFPHSLTPWSWSFLADIFQLYIRTQEHKTLWHVGSKPPGIGQLDHPWASPLAQLFNQLLFPGSVLLAFKVHSFAHLLLCTHSFAHSLLRCKKVDIPTKGCSEPS